MLFHSLDFLIFYTVVVVLYFAWPGPASRLGRYRWVLLLAASYLFYAWAGPEYLPWIAASTLIGYVAGILIARTTVRAVRNGLLAFSVVTNLGLLVAAKYLGFLTELLGTVLQALHISSGAPAVKMMLPIGISFYTLQTIGYAVDVHRGKIEPERHLGYYALFVSFFPKLFAGPIERAGHLLPQLGVHHAFSGLDHKARPRAVSGLRLALWGMFQKVVIADRLAVYVDGVYNHPAEYRGLPIFVAILFFAIQIYCDFAGYSDIAIGIARVMGFNLTPNFERPYFATSIADFWRRWHMSLSGWFRDYLYIPLGGNRVPRWRWYANLMIVFVASGLWHGAGWTFVLWGGLHGLYYWIELWTQGIRAKGAAWLHLEARPALRGAIAGLGTFVLVSFAWVFFRANSVSDAFTLIGNLVRADSSSPALPAVLAPWGGGSGVPSANGAGLELAFSFALIALLAGVEWIQAAGAPEWGWMRRLGLEPGAYLRWAVYLALALAIMNLGVRQGTPFVYMQF